MMMPMPARGAHGCRDTPNIVDATKQNLWIAPVLAASWLPNGPQSTSLIDKQFGEADTLVLLAAIERENLTQLRIGGHTGKGRLRRSDCNPDYIGRLKSLKDSQTGHGLRCCEDYMKNATL
jgi:hypothetical protein